MQKKWFTLIEIVVVISIIAILWVVASLSLTKWVSKSKDSKRLADLNIIMSSLELHLNSQLEYPIPDDYVDISYWTWIIAYQWVAWERLFDTIWLKEVPVDPSNKSYYTYLVNKNKDNYQLMTFFENNYSVSKNHFSDSAYSDEDAMYYPYVKWWQVWILTDTFNIPIQNYNNNIDVSTTTWTFMLYFANDKFYKWTSANILRLYSFHESSLVEYDSFVQSYRDFDKWVKTTLHDISSNWHNWTFMWDNWLPEWIDGIRNYWVRFDWVDDYILLDDYVLTGDFTVSTRIRPVDTSWTKKLISNLNDTDNYLFWLDFDWKNIIFADDNENISFPYESLEKNNWHNLAFVVNNENLKVYLNWERIWIWILWTKDSFTINNIWGYYNGAYSDMFEWIVDETVIYNEVLTDQEILAIYESKN